MSRYAGPIADTDVHHNVARDSDLLPYLAAEWRSYVKGNGRSAFPVYQSPAEKPTALMPNRGQRADAYPTDGSRSGSSYETMREQLLDEFNYYRAVLTHQLGDSPAHLNPYYAVAVCRAVNDWNLENWLSGDERLHSVVLAPTQLPDEAAAEIRRVGSHPRMVGVLIAGNTVGRPYGDPIYDPVHRAAADLGLPLVFHPSGCDRPNSQIRTVGGAKPTVMQLVAESGQSGAHYISSFLVNGVFERYPTLQVLFNEYGLSWLPQVIWGLDNNYQLLRFESPNLKRWPSEYIREHVRFSTQPIEESQDDKQALAKLLATVEGVDDMICYSSDYPHISYDDPSYVSKLIPAAWHRKVFCENACRLFGWKPPAPEADLPVLAEA